MTRKEALLKAANTIVHSDYDWGANSDLFWLKTQIANALLQVEREALAKGLEMAVWKAHVPVTNEQHNPQNGLLAGFCERCRTPWPCRYSPELKEPPCDTSS